MDKELKVLTSIANSLLKTTLEAYKFDNVSYYNHVYSEINKLIDKISKTEYADYFDLPQLPYSSTYGGGSRGELMKVISVLRQIISYLDSISGQDTASIEKLEFDLKKLNQDLDDAKTKERDYLDIIKSSRSANDYVVEDSKVAKFEGNNLKLIHEALSSFSVGAYTACICVCRNILQDIVQTACKQNDINEGSFKSSN
jgi:IS1 family transposase